MEMIDKYLNAFPYSHSFITEDSETLFFLKNMENGKKLFRLDLRQSSNYEDAIEICTEDFSKRSYRPILYQKESGILYRTHLTS
jgi:hypothetical protein